MWWWTTTHCCLKYSVLNIKISYYSGSHHADQVVRGSLPTESAAILYHHFFNRSQQQTNQTLALEGAVHILAVGKGEAQHAQLFVIRTSQLNATKIYTMDLLIHEIKSHILGLDNHNKIMLLLGAS